MPEQEQKRAPELWEWGDDMTCLEATDGRDVIALDGELSCSDAHMVVSEADAALIASTPTMAARIAELEVESARMLGAVAAATQVMRVVHNKARARASAPPGAIIPIDDWNEVAAAVVQLITEVFPDVAAEPRYDAEAAPK